MYNNSQSPIMVVSGKKAKESKRPIRGCIEISGCCM